MSFINTISKKIRTAMRVYREQGLGHVIEIIDRKLRYLKGRLMLPLRGNTAYLDGQRFNLDNPAISQEAKAHIFGNLYEYTERKAIRQYLPRELPVIELGAGIGIVSCITNRLLRHPQQHLLLEANPQLIPSIEENRRLNDCHFEVVNAALGYGVPEITLFINDTNFVYSSAKSQTERKVHVQTIDLAGLIQRLDTPRLSVICDLEGFEVDLIQHEIDLMSEKISVLILESHPDIVGEGAIQEAFTRLRENHFEQIYEERSVHVFRNKRLAVST